MHGLYGALAYKLVGCNTLSISCQNRINPVIYAEVGAVIERIEELDELAALNPDHPVEGEYPQQRR